MPLTPLPDRPAPTARPPLPWRSLLPRALAFALLWVILTEGSGRAWWLGAVTVAAALAASLWLWAPARRRASAPALLAFAGFFLWHSVRGGLAVAWLALRPGLALRPSLQLWRLRLPPGRGRVLLTDVMSLMPGTCSARLTDEGLLLHVLDEGLVSEADLRAAEHRIASALQLRLKQRPDPKPGRERRPGPGPAQEGRDA